MLVKNSRLSWLEKSRNVDVYDVKQDVIQTLVEAGLIQINFILMTNSRLLSPWKIRKSIFK